MRDSCVPGGVSDGSQLAANLTLSIEYPSIFSGSMCFVLLFFSFCRFCFVVVFVFMLSLESRRCSSHIFLFSRPRATGLATAYITGYMVEAQSIQRTVQASIGSVPS